jgi:hypothetical protein
VTYTLTITCEHVRDLGMDEQAETINRLSDLLLALGFASVTGSYDAHKVESGLIHTMSEGKVLLGPNGLNVRSITLDPAEIRVGAPRGQKILGKFSGDEIREDGVATEKCSIFMAVDDRAGMQGSGVMFFGIRDDRDRHATDDQRWKRQMAIAADGIWLNCQAFGQGTPGGPW